MRGKHSVNFEALDASGITPACAGKTSSAPSLSPRARDHPRVCGENVLWALPFSVVRGSPPRVRGKHDVVRGGARDVGITPACAGKTSGLLRSYARPRDHPRVCGENAAQPEDGALAKGSPPRVRGKLDAAQKALEGEGITPACAGKTVYKA